LQDLRDAALSGALTLASDSLAARFFDLLPLGNRAEDFGVAFEAIERAAEIVDQDSYDTFFATLESSWLEAFHRQFYEHREALRTADRERWIALHLPYTGLAQALGHSPPETTLAIATAKDRRSVEVLLEPLDLAGVIDPSWILDKETGVEKTVHLARLRDLLETDYKNITFIDDKVNHLRRVAPLGVQPVLAGWGFNTAREHRIARDLGYEIATPETVGEVLFKGA
jgi:phosphoglycolate phosphatase-like HAD superfamily hydrolase